MKHPKRALAAAAALLSLTLVTGCGGDDITVKTPDGKVKVDRHGEELSIETDEGTLELGSKLADGFPTDEVPLVEGKVITSSSMTSAETPGFTAMIQAEGSLSEVADDAFGKLASAGFEQVSSTSFPEMEMRGLKSPEWNVTVQVLETEDDTMVTYTVVGNTE